MVYQTIQKDSLMLSVFCLPRHYQFQNKFLVFIVFLFFFYYILALKRALCHIWMIIQDASVHKEKSDVCVWEIVPTDESTITDYNKKS